MASSGEVTTRRQKVGELWLRGVSTLSIATSLKMPERTVRQDIKAVRTQLDKDRVDEFEERRTRSIAVLRKVQQEAWTLYLRLQDGSTNRVGTLNVIHACEESIAKLEGTLGPNVLQQNTTVNVLMSSEWQGAIAALLDALRPYPEARIAASDALMQLEQGGHNGSNGA
jgi:hypothetical protein